MPRFASVTAVDSSLTGPPPDTPETPGRTRKSPRRLAAGAVALGALLLTGCQLPSFGAYKGATTQARSTFHLWQGFFIAGIVVGGFTLLLILWAVFRYRRRSDEMPVQTQYHTLTEIIYTVVPILIVLGLFVATVLVENKVTAVEPDPATSLHVYAFQWGWEFEYPNGVKVIGQTTDAPTMVIPTGQTVRIYLRSYDVLHGFYVPEFNFSRYASPGYWTSFDLNVLHNGVYRGQCTQLCGLYHSLMFFNVRSVSPSAYTDLAAASPAPSSGRTRAPSASSRPTCTPTRTGPCRATLAIRATPATRAAGTPVTQEVRSTVTDVIAPPVETHEPTELHLPPEVPGDGHEPHHGGHEDHGPTGILKWLTSTDHKVIGLSYMITSIVIFYLSGIMALILRLQLSSPHSSLLSFGQYNALFTMHGSLMLYLFAGPFAFGGLANYIVPLQVGAPDMAFPRLNALSYWLYLTGSITMLMTIFVAGGAAQFGWVAYAPLSSATSSPGAGPDLWIMALALTGFSAIFTGVNLCGTIFYLRRAGHDHVPHAHLHLEHAGDRDPDPHRLPRPHRGPDHALRRPPLRDAHLHGGRAAISSTACPCDRAGHRCSGRTSSGSSAIPRSTSSPCRSSAS